VAFIQALLEEIGFEKERIQMVNVSAAMGAQFAHKASEFSEKIREIGPNPFREENYHGDTENTENLLVAAAKTQ
jgi:F420-non-reducing hydrogenase iron-sulfur subunit